MTERFYKIPKNLAFRRDLKPSDKLVYAAITDRIGQNGFCWPGIRSLIQDCGLCRDTVVNSIRRLEAAGLLNVKRRGNGRVNHYKETGPKTRPVEKPNRSENQTTGGLKTRPEAVRKPDCNQTDPLNQTHRARGCFEDLWNAYPRKEAKAQAEKAFLKLKPTPELFSVMLTVLAQQKQSAQWQKDGGQFIPYPATWLNQRRWEDIPGKRDDDGMMPTHEVTEAEGDELLKGMKP